MQAKSRRINYEALRVLSMLMIISMHYLQKGGILLPLSQDRGAVNLLAWLIEAFSIGAANAYVLLAGYFLTKTPFKWKKAVSLLGQILFYSWGVALICALFGVGNVREWGLYDWMIVLFPLQSEHYWFATAYLVLYLMVPVLQMGAGKLSRRQLEAVICALLLFFSVEKTLSPIAFAYDRYGYDPGWFICLFLTAAWLRLYGEDRLKAKRVGIVYPAAALLIWGGGILLGILTQKGLPLSYMGDMLYSYNHLLVFVLSISLFLIFGRVDMEDGKAARLIRFLSPSCFGVYLLHEHIALRYLWPGWLGVESVRGSILFLPHMLISSTLVFFSGVMTDRLRSKGMEVFWQKAGRKKRGTAR